MQQDNSAHSMPVTAKTAIQEGVTDTLSKSNLSPLKSIGVAVIALGVFESKMDDPNQPFCEWKTPSPQPPPPGKSEQQCINDASQISCQPLELDKCTQFVKTQCEDNDPKNWSIYCNVAHKDDQSSGHCHLQHL